MSLVGRPSTHRDVMPVAIIVFLLCMGGLAYANMKKSEGKKDKAVGRSFALLSHGRHAGRWADVQATEDVEAAVSSRVAPAPESDEHGP